jgi:hypothetical protein
MANTFKSFGVSAVGTSLTDSYTAGAGVTSTVIGASVANINASTLVTVDVVLTKGATDYHLIKNAPVAPGGTLVVVGGDQKVVLETGNKIKVKSSLAASVDVVLSVLEITA